MNARLLMINDYDCDTPEYFILEYEISLLFSFFVIVN